jgi:hypothetical protein
MQLGFGVCANDELHGDMEYYYVVEHGAGTSVRAYVVEHTEDGPRVGACLQSVAVPQPLFSSSLSAHGMARLLARVCIGGVWYFRDDRLREFRRCGNPHERITFDELLGAA